MPKQGPQLLKVWDDWSAGVGYLKDDLETPGMYTASGILGTIGELRPVPKRTTVTIGNSKAHKYFFEEGGYLYVVSDAAPGGAAAGAITKIDLANATFGADKGSRVPAAALSLDQPERYQGKWYIGQRHVTDAGKIQELTTVGAGVIGNDTWTEGAVGTSGNHLGMIGFQLAMTHTGFGVRILKKDGDPLVVADWGPYFEVGDLNDPTLAIRGLQGAAFVATARGLYSFNTHGRAGLVAEDIRAWLAGANIFTGLTVWRGRLVMPHPNALYVYQVGVPLLPIGPESYASGLGSPPPGPTEWRGGLWHRVEAVGEHIFGIYAPDPTSINNALLMYGRAASPGSKHLIGWQVLGTVTLLAVDTSSGVGVATRGEPESSGVKTSTLWYNDSDDVGYMILDGDASPFRSRGHTHVVATSGDAYFSELFFNVPTKLSHFVVYAQDMASGDEWQMSGIVNAGSDDKAGSPVKANGRYKVPFSKENVYRLMAHVGWAATSSSSRIAPSLKRVELWGWPS